MKTLSRLIQERRETLGLTQEQLSEDIGVSVISLQFIEQGRRFPSLPNFFVLMNRLDLNWPF